MFSRLARREYHFWNRKWQLNTRIGKSFRCMYSKLYIWYNFHKNIYILVYLFFSVDICKMSYGFCYIVLRFQWRYDLGYVLVFSGVMVWIMCCVCRVVRVPLFSLLYPFYIRAVIYYPFPPQTNYNCSQMNDVLTNSSRDSHVGNYLPSAERMRKITVYTLGMQMSSLTVNAWCPGYKRLL